jgi:large subunit ribosomal protein L19
MGILPSKPIFGMLLEHMDTNSVATSENTPQSKSSLDLNTTFNVGDTVRVMYKIIEGGKERIQPFEGIVIGKKGESVSKTFTVRRIGAGGIGVERIFPVYSPNIADIQVVKAGQVRRAKLYYLRGKLGKAATKVKEKKAIQIPASSEASSETAQE